MSNSAKDRSTGLKKKTGKKLVPTDNTTQLEKLVDRLATAIETLAIAKRGQDHCYCPSHGHCPAHQWYGQYTPTHFWSGLCWCGSYHNQITWINTPSITTTWGAGNQITWNATAGNSATNSVTNITYGWTA